MMDDIFIFLICFFLFSGKSFTLRIYFYYNQEQTNKPCFYLEKRKTYLLQKSYLLPELRKTKRGGKELRDF